jgi:hypothetical protein
MRPCAAAAGFKLEAEAPLQLLFAHRICLKTGVQPRFRGAMLFGPMR